MHSLLFTLSALLALAAVHAAPGSQPSNVPTCTFSCPPVDQLGFAVGAHSNDGTNLFCSYPAVAGEDANDFFCKYSETTGALTQDHDAGLCAATATSSCITRRSAVPRAPAPPMAAPVARAPTPEEVKRRASLKRRKPVPVEA
ncbi:uncharacterized protein LACBIDRAFT_295587 [Laccaria bicolor S238N-H82]|uniref:Predicted protein n=1 Tax=Laccaria bicolor (strain S238N-H82 / ATCC MYA-4686) TaxID=486041 RepID=B0DVC4_LACBS|nr:uncharacterized protein LACBIDRAFT_295587 [Laccaria bicolor S238N-H82]EDR01552.1 predicted protein [Laccaria bicolor S238N-H82]|eukprot:XP_001887904.1 predicted protein [Laccaria bicolor S238N-H82]